MTILRPFVSLGVLGFLLRGRPSAHQRLRARRACLEGGNAWRDDPEAELSRALARASAEWAVLQTGAEAEEEGAEGARSARERRAERAAELLASSALDRLRPYLVPSEHLDIPPLTGGEDALRAFLEDDARLVANFLSGTERLSGAGQAFWQAELYIRSVHEEAGEATVTEAAQDAAEAVNSESEELQAALRGSALLARQNFISATRFGYFLCRGRQRLALEQGLKTQEVEEEPQDFLAQLRRVTQGDSEPRPPDPRNRLEAYLAGLAPEQAVEIARVATSEAARALDLRASRLFGEERDLLAALDVGPSAVQQVRLSVEGRRRLQLEAAAFGAALFEAEAAAAAVYELSYTAYGSRAEGPLR